MHIKKHNKRKTIVDNMFSIIAFILSQSRNYSLNETLLLIDNYDKFMVKKRNINKW